MLYAPPVGPRAAGVIENRHLDRAISERMDDLRQQLRSLDPWAGSTRGEVERSLRYLEDDQRRIRRDWEAYKQDPVAVGGGLRRQGAGARREDPTAWHHGREDRMNTQRDNADDTVRSTRRTPTVVWLFQRGARSALSLVAVLAAAATIMFAAGRAHAQEVSGIDSPEVSGDAARRAGEVAARYPDYRRTEAVPTPEALAFRGDRQDAGAADEAATSDYDSGVLRSALASIVAADSLPFVDVGGAMAAGGYEPGEIFAVTRGPRPEQEDEEQTAGADTPPEDFVRLVLGGGDSEQPVREQDPTFGTALTASAAPPDSPAYGTSSEPVAEEPESEAAEPPLIVVPASESEAPPADETAEASPEQRPDLQDDGAGDGSLLPDPASGAGDGLGGSGNGGGADEQPQEQTEGDTGEGIAQTPPGQQDAPGAGFGLLGEGVGNGAGSGGPDEDTDDGDPLEEASGEVGDTVWGEKPGRGKPGGHADDPESAAPAPEDRGRGNPEEENPGRIDPEPPSNSGQEQGPPGLGDAFENGRGSEENGPQDGSPQRGDPEVGDPQQDAPAQDEPAGEGQDTGRVTPGPASDQGGAPGLNDAFGGGSDEEAPGQGGPQQQTPPEDAQPENGGPDAGQHAPGAQGGPPQDDPQQEQQPDQGEPDNGGQGSEPGTPAEGSHEDISDAPASMSDAFGGGSGHDAPQENAPEDGQQAPSTGRRGEPQGSGEDNPQKDAPAPESHQGGPPPERRPAPQDEDANKKEGAPAGIGAAFDAVGVPPERPAPPEPVEAVRPAEVLERGDSAHNDAAAPRFAEAMGAEPGQRPVEEPPTREPEPAPASAIATERRAPQSPEKHGTRRSQQPTEEPRPQSAPPSERTDGSGTTGQPAVRPHRESPPAPVQEQAPAPQQEPLQQQAPAPAPAQTSAYTAPVASNGGSTTSTQRSTVVVSRSSSSSKGGGK